MGELALGQVSNDIVYVTATIAVIGLLWVIARRTQRVDTDRTDFKEFMVEIREKIEQIFQRLEMLSGRKGIGPASPLALNELGKKVSNSLNFSAWVVQLADDHYERTEEMSPYEIQEFCFAHVRRIELPDDKKREIQDCAFENGMSVQAVLDVLAIELRDKLLGDQAPP